MHRYFGQSIDNVMQCWQGLPVLAIDLEAGFGRFERALWYTSSLFLSQRHCSEILSRSLAFAFASNGRYISMDDLRIFSSSRYTSDILGKIDLFELRQLDISLDSPSLAGCREVCLLSPVHVNAREKFRHPESSASTNDCISEVLEHDGQVTALDDIAIFVGILDSMGRKGTGIVPGTAEPFQLIECRY